VLSLKHWVLTSAEIKRDKRPGRVQISHSHRVNRTLGAPQLTIMVCVVTETMEISVDGGCRGNGSADAIAAAAAVLQFVSGPTYRLRVRRLSNDNQQATNQRAEITAIILGLEMALQHKTMGVDPLLNLTNKSDSAYAVNCMNDFIYRWSKNGWRNSRRQAVANQDLIREASRLNGVVKKMGFVKYVWIPRTENTLADKHCNAELDAMEAEGYW
jgi:ribonuclease HI